MATHRDAIACAAARLLPPPWSSTASASLLHVGFRNLSTWREKKHTLKPSYATPMQSVSFKYQHFYNIIFLQKYLR